MSIAEFADRHEFRLLVRAKLERVQNARSNTACVGGFAAYESKVNVEKL